jgi:hypothetical protein
MATTTIPDVPLPEGTHLLGGDSFEVWDGAYRLVWGDSRPGASTKFSVRPCATQLPDGSIPSNLSNDVVDATNGIDVAESVNGVNCDSLSLTAEKRPGTGCSLARCC